MLTIYATKQSQPEQETSEGVVVHPVEYTLLCKDGAGNRLDIVTNRETYSEVSEFLDKLKQV